MKRATLVLAAAMVSFVAFANGAFAGTQTSLPANAGYPWSNFNVGGGYVTDYLKNDGSAGGTITTYTANVFDIDPDPNERDPLVNGKENIGSLTFQYVLYKEASGGQGTAADSLGAALFGGFHLTDTNDLNNRFAFLQIVNQVGGAGYPKVDGGGYRGKTNGDIPGYVANPGNQAGWNFAGTEFDYFDNPVRGLNTGQTVNFETALVNYNANTVVILADFTWSFTANGNNSSGTAPTTQALASNTLINLYQAANPNTTYLNIGAGSCHLIDAVPEPSTLLMLGIAGVVLAGYRGLRRRSVA